MPKITLTIPVRLTPQEKPLFDSRSPHAYRPSKEEEEIGFLVVNLMRKHRLRPIQGDVAISANVYFSGKSTGDIDHLLSTLMDSLKNVAFGDDSHVRMIERFCILPNSGQDCCVVEIRPIRKLLEEFENGQTG